MIAAFGDANTPSFDISSATLGLPVSFSTPKNAIPSAGIQVASKLIIIGPSYTRLLAYPFLLRLRVHRLEVELVVEVHGDDAVAALFALVIMDLSRRLRPHGSRPACLFITAISGELEYDFVLQPGASPQAIRLGIAGARRLWLEHGDLVLTSMGGNLRLRSPNIYQEANEVRHQVRGRYVIRSKGEVGFEVAAYDRRRALVIDPVLAYATYLGRSSTDHFHSIAVDSIGSAYVAGDDDDHDKDDGYSCNALSKTAGHWCAISSDHFR